MANFPKGCRIQNYRNLETLEVHTKIKFFKYVIITKTHFIVFDVMYLHVEQI